jgi:hypothetical protein
MSTYSTGQPPVDALKLQNFQAVLNLLPDNTQKLIAPKDVRDGLYTTWENIAFKPTKVADSDVEYIGIDQPLLKSKVYFGKKSVGGKEVMDDLLLNELDYDYYFFGTRAEPTTEHNTRIGFLAGTGSLYIEDTLAIPYIEAKQVTHYDFQKYINFEIRNRSYIFDGTDRVGGDISILSDRGRINLNGVVLPKLGDNLQPTNNDKYLKFLWDPQGNYGVATWSSLDQANITDIVSTGTVSITGSPILINGENILFTDTTEVPVTIGGIVAGSTFQNRPVTEVLRQLLYPYIAPTMSTSFDNAFIELGDTQTANNQKLNFTIRRAATYSINNFFMTPNTFRSGSSLPVGSSIQIGETNGSVLPFFNPTLQSASGFSITSFRLTLNDQFGTTITSTSNFRVALPWFYGTSTNLDVDVTSLNSMFGNLTSILRGEPSAGESVQVILSTTNLPSALGCVYFAYPSVYRDLTNIIDQNGYPVFSDYTKYVRNGVRSPQNRWGGSGDNRSYKIYVRTPSGVPAYTNIPPLSRYTFVF